MHTPIFSCEKALDPGLFSFVMHRCAKDTDPCIQVCVSGGPMIRAAGKDAVKSWRTGDDAVITQDVPLAVINRPDVVDPVRDLDAVDILLISRPLCNEAAFFLCARHGIHPGGESPLWERIIATANH